MKIKKADIVLAVIIAVVGVIASIYITVNEKPVKDGQVVIYVNHEKYGSYPLNEDREIEIKKDGHINKITIKEGNAQMTFADCHNQDCVKQGKISDGSESIICLPNKVVVEIKSKERKYDAVSN